MPIPGVPEGVIRMVRGGFRDRAAARPVASDLEPVVAGTVPFKVAPKGGSWPQVEITMMQPAPSASPTTAVPPASYFDNASNARAWISSTVPVPLIARYRGAAAGSALAQSA